jgi:Carboxypeptidase regulatory-like domain
MTTRNRWLTHLLGISLGLASGIAIAADVEGTVTDYVDGKPLDGARVYLMDGKTVKGGPIATVNGAFKFPGVGDGTYTIRIDLTGYTPRPDDHALPVKAPNKPPRVEAELMKEAAGSAYYVAAGARLTTLARRDGGGRAAYNRRWVDLRRIGPSPVEKIYVSRGIAQSDPAARQFLPVDRYVTQNPDDVARLVEACNTALLRQNWGLIPARNERLSDDVVADAVLLALRKSDLESGQKEQFVTEFNRSWRGSLASQIVDYHYSRERLYHQTSPNLPTDSGDATPSAAPPDE